MERVTVLPKWTSIIFEFLAGAVVLFAMFGLDLVEVATLVEMLVVTLVSLLAIGHSLFDAVRRLIISRDTTGEAFSKSNEIVLQSRR